MSGFVPYSELSGDPGKPALLLLNSMGTSQAMWAPQIEMLRGHFQVITMDHRGHGQSGAPGGAYSFDDLVGDAFGVLDRYGIARATVMGVSIGGMTALGMGLTASERVERIICVAARADAPPAFRDNWDRRAEVIGEHGVGALWDAVLPIWLTDGFRAAHPGVVAAMKAEFQKTSDQGYINCGEALKGLDYLKDLPKLTVPTLYIAGAEDGAVPVAAMHQMQAQTPGSQIEVIAGAGHIVNVNAPEAFERVIGGYLGLAQP